MMIKESLIAALSVTAALGFVQPAMANTSPINLDSVFEQSSSPLQIAALSKQEMQETKGAVAPALVAIGAFFASPHGGAITGAGIGVVWQAGKNMYQNAPINQGMGYAAGVGATMGLTKNVLIGASGGNMAANIAWRPGLTAFGAGVQMGNPANRPR